VNRTSPMAGQQMKSKDLSASWGVQLHKPREVDRTYVAVRDGTKLYVEVYRPDSPGRFPAILLMNPYHNVSVPPHSRTKSNHIEFTSRGYAVVESEVRGTGISEGKFFFLRNDGKDGYDIIRWIRDQPWCDGNVGLMGASYLGMDQFPIAARNPPGLKAMFVGVAGADLYGDMVYPGGILNTMILRWAVNHAAHLLPPWVPQLFDMPQEIDPRIYEMQEKIHCQRTQLMIKQALEGGGLYDNDFLKEWISHPTDGPFWRQDSPYNFFKSIRTPVYCQGGWFDFFIAGTIRSFVEIDAPKKLLIGPWFHGGKEGCDLLGVQLRWFDYWLKGIQNGIMEEPPVRVFVMGKDEWRFEDGWPPKSRTMRLYLRRGEPNPRHSLNDGLLSTKPAAADEEPDRISHDPANLVPSVAFRNADIRRAERACLTYTTEPLSKDIELNGNVELLLNASTNAFDVDWFAKLTRVIPEGDSIVISSGVLRASHRRSHEHPQKLVPGRVYAMRIVMSPLCILIPKGHRLRLDLANSDFPHFAPNLVASDNEVYHDARHRSCLILSVR